MTDDAGAAWLPRVASARLGQQRAEQISAAVTERAGQFERVARAAATLGERGPGPLTGLDRAGPLTGLDRAGPLTGLDRAGPSAASVAAGQACRALIAGLDGRLRAWAWTPPASWEAAAGATRSSALDGYVIAVKDVIDVAGMPTRAGSPLTSPEPARADAPVIARLRAAGLVIAGKSQCTEWALNDPAATVNPWDPACTPGGSSAGSAVAVATGMCTASVDTQTAGDVLRPACYNGVVGFKPSAGWASTSGTVRVAPTIDTIGVMARQVAPAAAVAAAIADDPGRFGLAPLSRRPRIGVLREPFVADAGDAAGLGQALRRLTAGGASVADVTCPVDLELVHAAHRLITFAECAREHAGRCDRGRYGPRARELIELGLLTPAYAYLQAQDVRRDAAERLALLFGDVDVLALPVTGPVPGRATTGDSRLQIPWTLCGFPAICLPTGLSDGRPQAVQLVAAPQAEATLLAVAGWCEQVLDLRLTPMTPT